MLEEGARFNRSKELLDSFLESRIPVEVRRAFDGLKKELEEKGYPIKAVVPMMSLQGEWAVKELMGRKRGYGDIDWGVVIDALPEDAERMKSEMRSLGERYFRELGQDPCTEINPSGYTLNIREMRDVSLRLGESSRGYIKGERESIPDVVKASLPYLSGDSELMQQYDEILKATLSEQDYRDVQEAMRLCVDWMQSAKRGKTEANAQFYETLNELRRLPHEKVTIHDKEPGETRSFGLIAIKPTGMTTDVPELIDYVLKHPENAAEDEVLQILVSGMSGDERNFFMDSLPSVNLRFTRYGDFSKDNSFWTASYAKRHSHKFWYEDLMEEVNKGTLDSYIVESNMSQADLEKWLDLFKGKENIVRTLPDGEIRVLRPGKGIRGMYDSEAVMVSNERLMSAADENTRQMIEATAADMGEDGLLFIDLPKDVAPFVWKKLDDSEKITMLGNFVHMTGKPEEVWDGVRSLLQPQLGDSIVRRLGQAGVAPEIAVRLLTDTYSLIKEANTEIGISPAEIFPSDQSLEKDKFSYGMFVVKPTGMAGDFPDVMKYLFNPMSRNDSNYEEVVRTIEETFDPSYRVHFREVLNETVSEASFYGAYEPGEAPYFWEANYLKKNGGKFYYDAMMEGFKGGQTVEIYLLRSTRSQEELDEWVKKVKGRETLNQTDERTGETETLYAGYGIRGLLEVEAIMFTEEKRQDLVSRISDPDQKRQVENYLKGVTLPMIYSRLPNEIQAIMWNNLPSSEQQAMISNFIHSPDDIHTVYDGVLELAKDELPDGLVAEIISQSGGRENVAIFDLVTRLLKKRASDLSQNKVKEYEMKYSDNVRALISAVDENPS
jgi:hypothetical protein